MSIDVPGKKKKRPRKKIEYGPETHEAFINKALVHRLRNASRWWKAKQIAKAKAKEIVQEGFHKNGKPKFKVKYRCAHCNQLFNDNEVQADHIDPVVDPKQGRTDWNDFIYRLFCRPEGYQILCKPDHKAKTDKENELRKEIKNG